MKKILILFLVLVLSLNLCGLTYATAETDLKEYNVQTYEQARTLIKTLINEDVFYSPQSPLTRELFAETLAKLLKLTPSSANPEPYFIDVAKDRNSFTSIQALCEHGIISKSEKFNPEKTITFIEAVKMVVVAAGYDTVAQQKGGWPNGYNYVALRIGLSDDIKNVNNLICADGAIILYNFLFAPALEVESYSKLAQGSIEEQISTQGNNYLKTLFDLHSYKGIVTQTSYNSLMPDYFDFDNFVSIDGEKYIYNDKLSPEMLGKSVTAIYSDDGTKELVCVLEGNNQTFVINGPDFKEIKDRRIYYRDGKNKTKQLDDLFVVIYNGRYVHNLTPQLIEELNSTITLLDNDNDGVYEVVFAESYTYGEIDSVDFVNDIIGISQPQKASFDINEENSYFKVINEDGKETGIGSLAKGMVVSVKCSQDGIVAEVRILNETVTGKIETLAMGNGEDSLVTIGNVEYKISNAFREKYFSTEILKLGEMVELVVADNNVIVALKSSDTIYRYGYLVDFGKTRGFGQKIEVEIFTSGGNFEIYTLKDKVVIDGEKKTDDDVYDLLDTGLDLKLVKYSLNNDGLINRLDTAETYENYVASNPAYRFGEQLPKDNSLLLNSKENSQYRTSFNGLPGFASLSGTVIFYLPADETDEDSYRVFSMSDIPGNMVYDWEAYDISLSGSAGAIIVRFSNMDVFSRSYSSFILEDTKYARMEDDEFVKCLYGWIGGKYRELYLSEDAEDDYNTQYASFDSKEFAPGDILRVSLNGDIINDIEIDFKLKENGQYTYMGPHNENDTFFTNTSVLSNTTNSGYYGIGSNCYVEGNVYSIRDGYIYVALNTDSENVTEDIFDYENLRLFKISGDIVLYNRETEEVRPISPEIIKTYQSFGLGCDHVIMRLSDSKNLMTLVVE